MVSKMNLTHVNLKIERMQEFYYTAIEAYPYCNELSGAPMGRGTTEEQAISDFRRRVGYETPKLSLSLTVTERRDYTVS